MNQPLTIAIAGRKGGVGKTTLAVGLAALCAARGLRTLLVDLDPQSNAAFALGVDPAARGTAALLLSAPVFAGAAPVQAAPGLAVYPGGPELTEAAVLRLHPEELMDALSQRAEEVVICDCPPGNEHLERLGLTAAAVALVVADAHPFAAIGAGRVLSDLGSMRRRGRRCPDRVALVLSRLDSRRASDRALPDRLAALHPDVPQLCLHQDAALAAATSDRVLIAGRTRGVLDLDRIAAWILEDPEPC